MTETAAVTYTGTAPGAALMAKAFEDEGLVVDFQPPREQRSPGMDLGTIVAFVVTYVATTAVDEAIGAPIRRAVRRVKARFPGISVKDAEGNEID